jgi:hypothetical protein
MDQHALWITTDRFEVSTPGPNFINPTCFGEDFALWLRPRLTERGITVSEPIQEDWGWVLIATFDEANFTVAIGVMDESIRVVPATWRIDVDYERPLNPIRRWFKPVPVNSHEEVFKKLEAVMVAEESFKVSREEPPD